MVKKIRSYFLTGLVVSAPVAITLAVGWWFINKIDAIFTPLLPNKFLPENLLPFSIPGVGLIIGFILLTFFGFLAANFLGTGVLRFGESLLNKTPVLRSIYKGLKQILRQFFLKMEEIFQRLLLLNIPEKVFIPFALYLPIQKVSCLKKYQKITRCICQFFYQQLQIQHQVFYYSYQKKMSRFLICQLRMLQN